MMRHHNKLKLLIFDVNETLLDMEPMKVAVNQFFRTESAFQTWFSTLLQYAMVESINPPKKYHHFGEIAKASLLMLSKKLERPINRTEITDILSIMTQLSPFSDVQQNLKALQDKGFRLVALTNGSADILNKQLEFSNLSQYFDAAYSVESVKSFKPQKITYEYALAQQSVLAEEALMVAAHSWDIHGANAVGLQTAFIARKGQVLYSHINEVTLICKDLNELSIKI